MLDVDFERNRYTYYAQIDFYLLIKDIKVRQIISNI